MNWILILLLASLNSEARSSYKAKRFNVSPPVDRVIAMGPFLKEFRPKFVTELCSENSYFPTCFKVDIKPCRTEVTKVLIDCQQRNRKLFRPQLPESQAFKYLKALGYCTGKHAEAKWAKKKQNSYQCRKIALWW